MQEVWKDENKKNNRVENLEWCDHAYNMKYGTQKERRLANMNFDEIAFKNRKQIVQLSKSGEKIKEWHGITTAAKALGIERRDISSCCKGKIKSAGGYVWRYLDAERERTTG